MSLSASLWTGVSGLLGHSEKMNVIGNNIANVNTIGFKSQRMDFSDFLYQDSYNNGGLMQVGLGVNTQTIITSFTQGPYESTTNPTDLAINGSGFFQVRQPNSEEVYYTRAGNFNFDKEGNLTDPNGYIVQGWKIENTDGVTRASGGLTANTTEDESALVGTGSPTDVKLEAWTVQPFATTEISFIPNLSADQSTDNSFNTTNPFVALLSNWDGTQPPASIDDPAIPQTAYEYSMPLDVYDEAGVKHKLTVYFDMVDPNDYTGGEDGGSVWEYIITMDPAEDKRQYFEEDPRHPDGGQLINMSTTEMAGMLGMGTISFNSSGQAVNQSTYSFLGASNPETHPDLYTQVLDQGSGDLKWVPKMNSGYVEDPANPGTYIFDEDEQLDPTNLEVWRTADISASGLPIITPNFTGILDAQTTGSPMGDDHGIEVSFGLKGTNSDQPWQHMDSSLADLTVEGYVYNDSYNALDPTAGPEYYLIDDRYNSKSMGQLTDIIDTAEEDWFDATFVDAAGNTITFDDAFWNTTSAAGNSITDIINSIAGSKANPGAAAAAQAEATAIINSLAALNPNPGVEEPLYETALRYQMKENVNSTGIPTPTATITLPNGSVIADPESERMQYIHSYLVNGSAQADETNLAEATPANANDLANFTKPVVREDSIIQSNAGSSATYSSTQNGYPFGNLSSYYVDQNGILTGVYSNGITNQLYQITMYDFTSPQNLRREGGNLYSQTLDSGEPKSGPAGVAGLGTITSETIEQSNVDLAREFVLMITTQRGFQGNSKMITTVDTMLDTVINMKR